MNDVAGMPAASKDAQDGKPRPKRRRHPRDGDPRKARQYAAQAALNQAEKELQRLQSEYDDIRKRETLLADLVGFGRDVCGFHDLNPKLHGSVADFIASGDALVCLLPREHLKSSLITVAYTCQQIAKNPDLRVCIYTVTQDLAQAFLRQIKGILKSERFQHWWGDKVPSAFEQETVDALTIKRSKNLKEPTVYATSVGASQVGFHFDLNIYDDIVDNRTVLTDGAMAKTEQWFEESLALHEKNSKLIYVGTRWHDSDLAGKLLQKNSYRHMVRSAIEGGAPIFPEKFDSRRLANLRANMNARSFSCQYLNDPVPTEDQTFRESDLGFIKELPAGETFITIDPSVTQGPRSDRTAIVVCRTDFLRRITIADIWIGKPDPGALIDMILAACDKWKPLACGLEQVAFQYVIQYFLQKEMVHTKQWYNVTPLKSSGRHKEERIMALEPFFRGGKVYIWDQCPHRNELVHEMIRFPRGRHDDILDALAFQLDLITYPSPRSMPAEDLPKGRQLLHDWLVWKQNDWTKRRPVLGARAVRA